MLDAGNLLIRLVALAGDQHDIAAARGAQCLCDRGRAVALHARPFRVREPGQDLGDYRVAVFAARIVVGNDDLVGETFGDRAHLRTFADIARVGPIAHQGRTIADTIADSEFTGVIAVATPEEMPVNETMTLADELARDELPLDLVIVNALYPARFEPGEIAELGAALTKTRSALARSALRAALSEHARAATQREQRDRLRERVDGRLIELPYLFADEVGLPQLEVLAGALEAAL